MDLSLVVTRPSLRLLIKYVPLAKWLSLPTFLRVDINSTVVKELLHRSRRNILSLSSSNETRTDNRSLRKWRLNYLAKLSKWLIVLWVCICTEHLVSLAKWLSVRLWTKWLWVRILLLSLKLQILHLFQETISLIVRPL